jgi:hypothetical protein
MGQRSQIILLSKGQSSYNEDKYYLEGVWHNQWHFGIGFLSSLNDLLTTWETAKRKLKQDKSNLMEYRNTSLANDLIEFVNVVDYPYTRRYSKLEISYEENRKCKDIFDVTSNFCDNNNGYIILLVDGDKLYYDIIGGTENFDDEIRVSAKKYLRTFYPTDEEIKSRRFNIKEARGFNVKEVKGIIENINSFKRFDSTKIKLN